MARKLNISIGFLILSAIVALLAMVLVGLGVYFGTKGTDCPICPVTTAKIETTAAWKNTTTVNTTVITTTLATTTITTTETPLDASAYRLPTSLQPTEYRLTIQPYFNNFTFYGHVEIDITCNETTNNLTLNFNRINFVKVWLSVPNGSNLTMNEVERNNKTMKISFANFENLPEFKPGEHYTVIIDYWGELADDLAGFYRGKYVEDNVTKFMAMTQFEPEDARRALPCFDEPAFKAVFSLTIIHPSDMVAIGNAMEISTELRDDGWKVTKFNPTKKMSTYLLAFAVADFVNQTRVSNTTENTIFRIWSRRSLFDQTNYAADIGPKVLEYYEQNFNVTFPLKKQDMLAAPEFSAGAMENWGLVTYREYDILYDNITYGPSNKRNVALVIAHELAHQWFGDLVTLAWWDDLWLNEGFAAYNEYDGSNHVEPALEMYKDFVVEEYQGTMQIDQLNSSHPIYMPELKTADEINANFDTITYDKGASMIYMLRNTITMETFLDGLNAYLVKHQYGNAQHEDLWEALTQAVAKKKNPVLDWNNKPLRISDFMNPWILQTGFPVVSVNRSSSSLTLSQKRFLLMNNGQPSDQTWPIPVFFRKENSLNTQMDWLQGQNNMVINLTSPDEFILLNYNMSGFFRVAYDKQSWDKILTKLHDDPLAFPADNRAQFIDDSMNLARAKYIGYEIPFKMICYLNGREEEASPWVSALTNLDYIGTMLASDGTAHIAIQKFTKSLLTKLYNNLTWTEETEENRDFHKSALRATVTSVMCERLKYPQCTKTAAQYFHQFYQACSSASTSSGCSNPVNPNLRATVYCAGVSVGDSEVWENLWNKYKVEPVANERQNLMRGLACSTDTSLLTKLLNELVNGTYIAAMDSKSFFAAMSANQISHLLIWDFIESNWDRIRDRFTHGYLSFSSFVRAATVSFNTVEDLEKVKSFMSLHSNELGTGLSAFNNALETIQVNINWMQDNADFITSWLQKNSC